MHEMGIALEVARIAREEAEKISARRIEVLNLRVGRWSGVEPETLRFALETLSEDFEQLKGCRVEIETVEPTFHCDRCAEPFVAEGYFDPCPRCGGPGGALVGGDEMLLTSIEVEDA